jgi:hypothetical protein
VAPTDLRLAADGEGRSRPPTQRQPAAGVVPAGRVRAARRWPRAHESLFAFLTRVTDKWETGTRLLNHRVLTEVIAWADPSLTHLFAVLDPDAPVLLTSRVG